MRMTCEPRDRMDPNILCGPSYGNLTSAATPDGGS